MKRYSPFVMILSGVPMSGKSTWLLENYPDVMVISRDNILLELANTKDYGKAFADLDSNLVDKVLNERILLAAKSGNDVIIDMIHASLKSRRRSLGQFSKKYYKVAVSFPLLSSDEYVRRNEFRRLNENKFIPVNVLNTMIESFVAIGDDEGFDKIIKI